MAFAKSLKNPCLTNVMRDCAIFTLKVTQNSKPRADLEKLRITLHPLSSVMYNPSFSSINKIELIQLKVLRPCVKIIVINKLKINNLENLQQ